MSYRDTLQKLLYVKASVYESVCVCVKASACKSVCVEKRLCVKASVCKRVCV